MQFKGLMQRVVDSLNEQGRQPV